MKTEESPSVQWNDIVFENRNKEYGAYLIRNIYGRHVIIAAIIAVGVLTLVLAFPTIVKFFKSQEEVENVELKTVKYTDLAPPPPIDKNTPPPPKLDIPPPVKTIIKFLPPKVTDKEVEQEEEMPTIDEVKKTDIGAENIEGTGEVIFDEPVEEITQEENDENKIFTVVEQQAEYPGGFAEMSKFVGKNLKYPAAPRRMEIEGTVFVSFVVNRDGQLTDIKVIKGIHPDCDKEAIRVIQLMPPWKPGKQAGRPVRSTFVLPIKFKLAT